MADQLPLVLPVRQASGRADFFVSPANALALAEIDRWQSWPTRKLALVGPEASGKSHLVAVWAETVASGRAAGVAVLEAPALPTAAGLEGLAVAVEAADRVAGDPVAEEALLHLHNHVLETGGRLLLTARSAPARWPVSLPDLASRLEATPVARLAPPDDALLRAILGKLFADRQLGVSPDLIEYCIARMERSFAAAQALVAELDARALAEGRRIGPRLAGEVLDASRGSGHNS